jgi:kynurenine formamidase
MNVRILWRYVGAAVVAGGVSIVCLQAWQTPTVVVAAAAQRGQGAAGGAAAVNDSRTSKEELERWMTELSNWGRWGKDDELGAANLITPAKRKQALALAKTGETVSLSHDPISEKAVDANEPFEHNLSIIQQAGIAVEKQEVSFHGSTFTHLDAFCHVSHDGKLYNGNLFADVVSKDGGCKKLAITAFKNGIVTRGILLDLPRLKGVPYLEAATHVYREDVEAWEKKAGVKVSSGDAIFLRTGRWARRAKEGPFANLSGYDGSFAPFLKQRDVALIGSDGIQDVGRVPGFSLPIHQIALVALGVNIFDNLDLEALSETAARLNRWEFLLFAAPIPVTNGTGSLINPIAVF